MLQVRMLFRSAIAWLMLLLSILGLFLSSWISVPAPTLSLLALSVAAPELSPWLFAFNLCILCIAVIATARIVLWPRLGRSQRFNQEGDRYLRYLHYLTLGLSIVGLVISALPLSQLPATLQQTAAAMEQGLGADDSTLNASLMTTLATRSPLMRPQPFQLMTVFTGLPIPTVRHTSGIQFAAPDGVPLTLEVYRPPAVGRYPAIIVIYGGAWQHGSPANDAAFNRYMAAQGYTVVAIDYRHAPQFRFPAQLTDVQTALAYIRQQAATYEIDPDRMAIMGRSAGAHLALLAAYQPGVPLRAVVSYYGPTDLIAGYNDLPHPDPIDVRAILSALIGGSPSQRPVQYQLASPSHYVRPHLPPTLLVYGGRDHIVKSVFGEQLFDRLRNAGNTAVFLKIPWAEHAFDVIFSGIGNQIALYHTERFFAWALQKPGPPEHHPKKYSNPQSG